MNNIILILVLVISLFVMFGWFFGIPFMKTLISGTVTIKFTTALFSLLTAIGLIARNTAPLIAITASITIMMLNLGILYSGDEVLFPFASQDSNFETVSKGLPSLGTLLSFMITSAFLLFYIHRNYKICMACTISVLLIAITATVGYLLNAPYLYYFIPEKSTGMSPVTIIILVALVASMFISQSEIKKDGTE